MSIDDSLIKLTADAIKKLDLAINETFKTSQESTSEKYSVGKLGRAIGLIREFQEPIFERRPKLEPPTPKDYVPDPPLSNEEIVIVNRLNEEDIKKIDQALLSNSSQNWSKVARIVGSVMLNHAERIPGIPDIYYAQRICHLVEQGMLEAQGNLAYMRYSEVRIPIKACE